jgi:GNAT superfamily N-acetyltransferase
MVNHSPELPEGFKIRRLQLNDRDRLALYVMPNDPQKVLPFLSMKWKLIYHQFKLAFILINIIIVFLFLVILPNLATMPLSYWLGMGSILLLFIGGWIIATFAPTRDWHRFCWVVAYKGRFVAYGVLRPYSNYSMLEQLFVHPNWARKGIGSTLVKTLIHKAKKPVYVESAIRVVDFYIRLGFRKIHFRELPSDVQKYFSLRGVATLLVYNIHQEGDRD